MRKETHSNENDETLYLKAIELFNEHPTQSIKDLKKLAKKDNLSACMKLAEYYESQKDYKAAAHYYYQVFSLDKIKGLKPFFKLHNTIKLPSSKRHDFLTYATDVGLFKAKYQLALFYLKDKAYYNPKKGEAMLLDYVQKTDDLDAIISLYELYSPVHKRYANFPDKDIYQAAHYYQKAIEKDSALFGSDIFDTEEVFIDHSVLPIEEVIEMILFRFKTSLSIDMTFERSVTIKKLNPLITLNFKPITDYKAKVTVEKTDIESTDSKSHTLEQNTIEKHLQTKKQLHDLKAFIHDYKVHKIPIDFNPVNHSMNLDSYLNSTIKNKLKPNETIASLDYEAKTIYLLEPVLTLDFIYQKKRYKSEVTLDNLESINRLNYPLESKLEHSMHRYINEHKHLKRDTFLLTFINTAIFMNFLYSFHFILILFPLIYLGLSLYLYRFKIPSKRRYLHYYDTLKLKSFKTMYKANYIYALITLLFFIIALFTI